MTASRSAGIKSFRHYYRTLEVINVVGWTVSALNIVGYILLISFTLIDGLEDKHNYYIVPTVGFVVDVIFQIIYAITYGYSKTLMICWGYNFPELGDCGF